MSLSVDVLSIILFITLSQGFFILSILAIKYRVSQPTHLFLFLMVLVLMWFQGEFLSVRLPFDVPIGLFYGTRYGAWFILGPLFYLYVSSVSGTPIKWSVKNVLHFVPFILFVVIIPWLTGEFLSFRQVNYGMLSTFDPFNDNVTFIQYFYSTVFVTQFVHLLIYLVVAYRLIRNYEMNVRENYSSIEPENIRWLKLFDVSLLLVLLLVAFFLTLFFVTRAYDRNYDYLYVVPMAVLTYLISYKLAGVQWRSEVISHSKSLKYEKSSLREEQARAYSKKLGQLMSQEKPYLDNELRLQELAGMLDIQPHHLSQVINEYFQQTFYDYVNRYRVEKAKELIMKEKDVTLLEIGFKAGFNNKTSFTNAFKKFTSQTPAEFKKASIKN